MTDLTAPKTPEARRLRDRPDRLDAAELADAAVTAAIVVSLLAAGRVLASGSLFQVIASFVVAVLAARRRSRAVLVATICAATIALLLGGLGPVSQAALAGVFGWAGGQALKRGWGRVRSILFTVMFGWPAMTASIMFFYPAVVLNKKLRQLIFDNVENQADGMANILGRIGWLVGKGVGLVAGSNAAVRVEDAFGSIGDTMRSIAAFLIDNWLLLIPTSELVFAVVYSTALHFAAKTVLRRVNSTLVDPVTLEIQRAESPEPVPVSVDNAGLSRGGRVVTGPISITVLPGEHVVVVGPNGAGKSTLLDALAGLNNHQAVSRPGHAGLGATGGTARVGQRPEAQVVGTTVGEDLRWGLHGVLDKHAALSAVGLDVPIDRPTSELSGGELQRLALTSAIQRRPRLLLVDEVTSMLDPEEQRRVITLLDELDDTAVVRTTHRDDASPQDRHVAISPLGTKSRSSQRSEAPDSSTNREELSRIETSVTDPLFIRLSGVGFAHHAGQPWELPVLDNINLSVHRYEMLIIEGRNGAGKTTLARIIAGALSPTKGTLRRAKGVKLALAYQHVRLQLLRPTVEQELRSLAGLPTDDSQVDTDNQRQAMRSHNLRTAVELFELPHLQHRKIDELSGGEQRRLLLAGLVARGVSLLVLDEPLAGLDATGRQELADALDLVRLAGTSVVVVSHDTEWSPPQVTQRLVLRNGALSARTV